MVFRQRILADGLALSTVFGLWSGVGSLQPGAVSFLLGLSSEYPLLVGEPAARLGTRTQEFTFHASQTS